MAFFVGNPKIKIKIGMIKNPPPSPTIEEIRPIEIPAKTKIKFKITISI